MKFLARDEASLLEKKLRREIAEQADPKSVLYYESGNRDYAAAANAIALSIGKFPEATLVFLVVPWRRRVGRAFGVDRELETVQTMARRE